MRPLVIVHVCLSLVLLGGMFVSVEGQTPGTEKKKTAKKKIDPDSVPSLSKLDKKQLESLGRLDRMFQRLYGLAEELPADAAATVRTVVFDILNAGTHEPKQANADKVTNLLIEGLRSKQIATGTAYEMIRDTADVLAADNVTKDDLDGFVLEAQQKLAGTTLAEEKSQEVLAAFQELVLSGKKNEKKIEEREEAAKREAERKEKELKKKLEEIAKKAERKAKGAGGSRSGSRGYNQ